MQVYVALYVFALKNSALQVDVKFCKNQRPYKWEKNWTCNVGKNNWHCMWVSLQSARSVKNYDLAGGKMGKFHSLVLSWEKSLTIHIVTWDFYAQAVKIPACAYNMSFQVMSQT